jgi:predicted metal-dependent hydrolase
MPSIQISGRQVDYRITRNPRARGLRLVVDARGVRVTLPRRTPERLAEAALRSRGEWVLDALDKVRVAAPAALGIGDLVPLLDGVVPITAGGSGICVDPSQPVDIQVEQWFRRAARGHLGDLVEEWALRLGVTPRRVVVRGQRSRWGSASTRGEISLNWRLMMAPTQVGEYVVIHELAHLLVMDHSPRYWAVVARHCPDHLDRRRWLRLHGDALLQGPAGTAQRLGLSP